MRYLLYLHQSKYGSLAAKIPIPAPDICMGLLLDDLFPAGPGEILREKGFVTQHYGDSGQNDDTTKV